MSALVRVWLGGEYLWAEPLDDSEAPRVILRNTPVDKSHGLKWGDEVETVRLPSSDLSVKDGRR